MLIKLNNFTVEAKLQDKEDIFLYNFKNKEGLVPFSFIPYYREDINKFKKEIKEALNNQKEYLDLNKNKKINIKEILKNEIKEALAYPTSKSYINMYKETLNYPKLSFDTMKEGTYWGYFMGGIIKNFKEIIKKADIKPKYTLGEMLVYDNLQLEEKGENSKVINIAINYFKKFRKEIKKSKNSYEMQQTLLKYRKVFDRYGTPQVGAINFNSSNKKSITSNTDNLTWCFGTCVAHLFDDYIKIFNDKHNLNLYCYREPFKMSKISKFFNSYCDFWEYSHRIKF